MRAFCRSLQASFLLLAMTAGAAHAAGKPDPNVDRALPDPGPNDAFFPPSAATAGTADPAPALYHLPLTAAMRAGREPDCTALSPCAVDSPPLEHLPPH